MVFEMPMAISKRSLTRGEKTERNRAVLLAAARRVFLVRGFHGATLDAIAEEAGFSKGVVYSQFESKADLFLALVAERIAERAAQNDEIVRRAATPAAGLAALLAHGHRIREGDREWALVLLEFRVHAARDAALNARYARLHAQTVERLATALAPLVSDGVATESPRTLATFLLAFSVGAMLEAAVTPQALPSSEVQAMLTRAFGVPDAPLATAAKARHLLRSSREAS
jgi:AcrR family transcriptional regulator